MRLPQVPLSWRTRRPREGQSPVIKCNSTHGQTGKLCQLPYHHVTDGLPLCQNGDVRWAVGPVNPAADHGIPGPECDDGTCDCAGDVPIGFNLDSRDYAVVGLNLELTWLKPEDVTIIKDTQGNILAYGVKL